MTGHFASVCRTKSKQEQKKKNTQKQGGRGKVNCVEDGEDDEYAFTVGLGKSWAGVDQRWWIYKLEVLILMGFSSTQDHHVISLMRRRRKTGSKKE